MTPWPDESVAPVVHVVEDDPSVRMATARMLRAAGHAVHTYRDATEFLGGRTGTGPGCVVLDLHLPGPSGFDVQRALAQAENPLPVVFLTGRGDVPQSVLAMKAGAVDFLTKSADGREVLDAVSRAIARSRIERANRAHRCDLEARYARLSPREQDVFAHVISGQLNKQIAFDLGIAEQTIKIHRHRIFDKMKAESIADLVRMATELRISPIGRVR